MKSKEQSEKKTPKRVSAVRRSHGLTKEKEKEIMHDFDGEKYINAYCNRVGCHVCDGTDFSGEPNGYGCDGQDKRISIMYESILKRRLKKLGHDFA